MAKVKVYPIKVWDQEMGNWMPERGKFTHEAILNIRRAEILDGGEEEVDESELDDNGRYLPPAKE